ncbi:MAG: cytochrome c3 family protein, partial [Sulfurimicrobium sp.]|nr:cytochrome c3 family protein [Sulfurimicrobium sp.]
CSAMRSVWRVPGSSATTAMIWRRPPHKPMQFCWRAASRANPSPVRDNCGNCHDPHGSNHDGMLKMRQPFLCQSCHQSTAPAPHINNLMDGRGTVPGTMNRSQVVNGCGNCHSLIHGSNHPSGNTFQR